MAKIHQKGDGTEAVNDDIPVVAPINMGMGLVWNKEVGQYEVLSDETLRFEGDKIGVQLSKDSENQLEVRKDGLYYGIKPPKDTSNLYVSSSQGDDKNAGTKESPLCTIKEAFKRNRANQHFLIHLYESDVHEWRASWGGTNQYTYTMEPYGPTCTQTIRNNPVNSIGWARSKELKRPIVEFVLDVARYGELQSSMQVSFSTEDIVFNGLRFRIRQVAEATSIPWGIFGGATGSPNIIFRGCEFDLNAPCHYVHVGKPMTPVILDHCKMSGSGMFGSIEPNGSIALGFRAMHNSSTEGSRLAGKTTSGEDSPLTYNGFTPEADIIAKLKGNTVVARGGIFY